MMIKPNQILLRDLNMSTVENILANAFLGKTLVSTEFGDNGDLEYQMSINLETPILPSKINDILITKDDDGDFRLRLFLENGTSAYVYENEDVYLN
jgi:hypothetical protein